MPLKNSIVLMVAASLFMACTQKKADTPDPADTAGMKSEQDYFPPLYKVLKAHGGIEKWNQQQTLSYDLPNEEAGNETHTIDLKTRNIKIAAPNFTMGNDEGTVWLKQDSTSFEGSPRFYHSLMFYFHTMPFVFADDGINYEEVLEKEIKGKTYKGIKMSFDENVGDAPKDQYILYYDPETYKMEWLAYNSTFSSQEKSDQFNMIHYKKWKETDGFLLPTEIVWHQYENGEVGDPRSGQVFAKTSLTEKKMEPDFYNIPGGAEVDSGGTK